MLIGQHKQTGKFYKIYRDEPPKDDYLTCELIDPSSVFHGDWETFHENEITYNMIDQVHMWNQNGRIYILCVNHKRVKYVEFDIEDMLRICV